MIVASAAQAAAEAAAAAAAAAVAATDMMQRLNLAENMAGPSFVGSSQTSEGAVSDGEAFPPEVMSSLVNDAVSRSLGPAPAQSMEGGVEELRSVLQDVGFRVVSNSNDDFVPAPSTNNAPVSTQSRVASHWDDDDESPNPSPRPGERAGEEARPMGWRLDPQYGYRMGR
jgi:hypothetical protein